MSSVPAPSPAVPRPSQHLPVLDGVRAVSIIVVLITHLMPVRINGAVWNGSVGMFGMALFFVLSGYLITVQLLQRPSLRLFASRRLFRIVPAAWLCIAVVCLFEPIGIRPLLAHLFFYANLPPVQLTPPIDHFWSLCVEMQFYVLAAVLLLASPVLTWWLLPLTLLGVTALRVSHGITASSITWYRADDLLAGAVLALLAHSRFSTPMREALRAGWIVWALALGLCVASVIPPQGANGLAYLRPYLAAALVAALMSQPEGRVARVLGHRWLAYIASISYALYIWHLPLAETWLGSGDLVEKYLKRPLLLAVIFAVAHVSTFYFEKRFIAWGRQLGTGRSPSPRGGPL